MSGSMASTLRGSLATKPVLWVAGAHDGISAKLVERNGFDAIWASSFEISTSHGVPDAGILTMSELLEAARSMVEVVGIPVIADCDNGFGDPANVCHMAHRYAAAGVAAVCIEDKQFPKVNSLFDGHQSLATIEDFSAKIRSAVCCRGASELMVFARIEALIANRGLDEALRRADAYADAGADVILIHSRQKSPEEVLEFARRWQNRTPLAIIPTTYYGITEDDVHRAGIRVVIHANHAMRSAVRAMNKTLASIAKRHSSREVEGEIASVSELFELEGMSDLVGKYR